MWVLRFEVSAVYQRRRSPQPTQCEPSLQPNGPATTFAAKGCQKTSRSVLLPPVYLMGPWFLLPPACIAIKPIQKSRTVYSL
jgi:hypothetical protein